ncbi:nucleotidyltransferase family protein [Corynebacterium halotolerans YIM 70093 = DSM 44683]|uniref:Nucleotidyltransferase family protein n=1 Tax=Corynebacterium halotolerans YIM 70093 = DSM 44683 TaxID=1121362 RepID=M1NTR8_9CORY|nr:nucleotidyltransferase family protein [Corynebacterium halotolerans YIM 70093 = DSM 44683]
MGLTVVLADEIRGGGPPRTRDFQFGEWLRTGLLDGELPGPETDPDVTVLIASALADH